MWIIILSSQAIYIIIFDYKRKFNTMHMQYSKYARNGNILVLGLGGGGGATLF